MEDYINPRTSMYLVGFLLVITSILSLLFVAFSDTNRKRYVFIKNLRFMAIYIITPAFAILFLAQVYSIFKYNYLSLSNSLVPMVYMIGGGWGIFLAGSKFRRTTLEGISHFRRGSFNSAKFQKVYSACRLQLIGIMFLCIAILGAVYLFR